MVRQTASMQYSIELAAAGLEDYNPKRRGHRLDSLLACQDRWRNFNFQRSVGLRMSNTVAYELSGGVFGQQIDDSAYGLKFYSLPSRVNETEGEWTVHEDLGFASKDFATDATQDLLIVTQEFTG